MKTRVFFICVMLFWSTMSGLRSGFAQDLTLPAGARARLALGVESRCGIVQAFIDRRRTPELHLLSATPTARFNQIQAYYLWDFDYSPDGGHLAVADTFSSEGISLYDARTAQKVRSGAPWSRIRNVVFSPDGKTIAAGRTNGEISLIDTATLSQKPIGRGYHLPIAWLSPDRSTLAWVRGDYQQTNFLHLSNLRGGSRQRTIPGHKKEGKYGFPFILSVGFDSRARTLASASQNGIIHLWDANDGSHLQEFRSYVPEPKSVEDPNGEIIHIYEGERRQGRKSYNYSGTFNPNGHPTPVRVAVASLNDWGGGISNPDAIADFDRFPMDSVEHPANTIDLFEKGWREAVIYPAVGFSIPVRKELILKHTFKGHTRCVWNVVYGEDGEEVASASIDGTIRTWDVQTGVGQVHASHTLHFSNIAFSRNGKAMAVGSDNGTIYLRVNGEWWSPFKAHDGPVTSVAFHPWWKPFKADIGPDEIVDHPVTPTLASAGTDGTVRLWSLQLGTRGVIPREEPWVFYVKPLGSEEDFERVAILRDPSMDVGSPATSVAFSPNGSTLAIGSWNGVEVLKLWTAEQGSPPIIYSAPVMSVAFSPESQTLAAGCLDGTIRMGRMVPGGRTGILKGHTDSVFKVMFSPDGRTLASGSDDGTVLLWNHQPSRNVSFRIFNLSTSEDANGDADDASPQEDSPEPEDANGDADDASPQEDPAEPEDANGDGEVDLKDLIFVNANLGKTGENPADVNQDGVVDIQDVLLVADALNAAAAAAPAAWHRDLEFPLTRTQVAQWLAQARQLNRTERTSQRGIRFLEQLLTALTPQETGLLPNYPNPFNPETWIPYQLAKPSDVTVRIYAMDGSLVRTLALGYQTPGIYQSRGRAAYWDGKNELGEPVASGPYFYTLTAGEFRATRKLLIQK